MLSVIIITKNEAHNIGKTLQSLQGLSDDIVIVDSGSTDDTIAICKKFDATIIETTWDGYGANKNKGISAAKHEWVLSLDADESLDQTIKQEILNIRPQDEHTVYKLRFQNFFCEKRIRFGVWASDYHIRLFNRTKVRWNTTEVHETLTFPADVKILLLKGNVLHYTVSSISDYTSKMINYAKLSAEKYHQQGKKAGFLKLYISPLKMICRFRWLSFIGWWPAARRLAWYASRLAIAWVSCSSEVQ